MKKFLYIMPAVLVCMLYMLLAALAGGITGFQPIAFIYICCPLAAGILLRSGKWWGGLFGIAMGALLVCNSMKIGAAMTAALAFGIVFILYYALMCFLCAADNKKK